MSQITLSANASGSAIFTVAAPGTSTNQTLTLPDATGILATLADVSSSSGVNIQSFTASGTYTPTAGYTYAIGIVTGGGQGGQTGSSSAGAGGAAGGTVIGSFSLSGIGTPAVTVGAGGGPSLVSGGTSSIGTTLSAYGGGNTIAYTGLVQIEGGSGGPGFTYQVGNGLSGYGGASFWGGGGRPAGVGTATGGSGTVYGSGGAGGQQTTGGSGKSGIVVIMEFK
jgi:hypothetical protein